MHFSHALKSCRLVCRLRHSNTKLIFPDNSYDIWVSEDPEIFCIMQLMMAAIYASIISLNMTAQSHSLSTQCPQNSTDGRKNSLKYVFFFKERELKSVFMYGGGANGRAKYVHAS